MVFEESYELCVFEMLSTSGKSTHNFNSRNNYNDVDYYSKIQINFATDSLSKIQKIFFYQSLSNFLN
jgi:hypothetical protein